MEATLFVCPSRHHGMTRENLLTESDVKHFVENVAGIGTVQRAIKLTADDGHGVAGNCRSTLKHEDMWQVSASADDRYDNAIVVVPYSLALPSDMADRAPYMDVNQDIGVVTEL